MRVQLGGEVYVQVARGLHFDGRSLTLVDLAPSTICSTPTGGVGYLPTGAFLDLWAQRTHHLRRPESFQVRATLSLLDPDARLAGDATLTVASPRVTAAGLAYHADVQQGLVPTTSGACVLFLEWDNAATTTEHAESASRHQRGVPAG